MKFDRKGLLASLVAPVFALLAVAVQAAEPGFYIGAGGGQTTLKTDLNNGSEIDEDDTGWKAFLGYQFVPWLGVEAGYVELGSGNDEFDLSDGTNIQADVDVGGWEAYLVPSLPLGEHFEIFGKIGAFTGDVTADGKIRHPDGTRSKFDESSDDEGMWAYGGGVAWNFGKGHWTLRAEYIEYDADDLDDLYMVSGSLVYRFFSDKVAAAPVAAAPVEAPPAACSDADNDGVCDTDDVCPGTDAGAKVDAIGCNCHYVLTLEFGFDSAELSPNDMAQLDEIVPVLTNPKAGFMRGAVAGHTDSSGPEAYNLKLSERRAASVVDYLISKGVSSGNFTVNGYGESQPVASNDTAEGRAKNRRIELHRNDCEH